jgi:hypothetical protein
VARAKTVIELLAEQPTDELIGMRLANEQALARAQSEVGRLELERQQIEAAMAKRERGPGRPGSITGTHVLDAAYDTGPPGSPLTAAAVQATLAAGGLHAHVNSVRNHLNRLVKNGDLRKDVKGRFSVVTGPEFVPAEFVPTGTSEASADDDFGGSDEEVPF